MMKTRLFFRTLAVLLIGGMATSVNAQGVIVHKKGGQTIKVPYEELDSISTYDYDDEPDVPTPGPEDTKTYTVNGVSFTMIAVGGGTFTMGATPEQTGYSSNELPTHQVTLDSYSIGETEVTQELWQAVMGYKPTSDDSQWSSTYGLGAQYPAYYISWDDCQSFITKLNSLTGEKFRMPTEAEWEYAARGGNKSQKYLYSGSNTIGDVAWYTTNSNEKTHEVKTKSPNELGIYDMSGNVWEWCSDWYGSYSSNAQTNPTGATSGFYRVYRGGSWYNNASYCRVAYRNNSCIPSYRYNILGLRLVQ